MFLERYLMPLTYRNTNLITVSPSSKAEILAHKITSKEPAVIYNGINKKVYLPGEKSPIPTILYVGRLTALKSIHVLIKASKNIIQAVPDVRIIIAGEGADRRNLERLVSKYNLQAYFQFTGRVTEPEKILLYQRAWVFVNPSLIEGWGITTIEANACGTPVVASNVPGLRDAVNNPHSGILIPYGNSKEFASAISELLTNATLRKRMSRESVMWASRFDWDKSAKDAMEILMNGGL